MRIIEFFTTENTEHWLNEIRKCDWGAGQYLYQLLSENNLKNMLGATALVPMLVDGDELIAFCTFAPLDDIQPTDLTPWIGFVYTYPKHRGHHYAGMLFDYGESIATIMGREYVYISTNHTGLYEKYGYEFYKIDKDVHGEDSRVYRKALQVDGVDKDRRSENGARWKTEIVKEKSFQVLDKIHEVYDFKKSQEIIEEGVNEGIRVLERYLYLKLVKAKENDYNEIMALYDDIIDNTSDMDVFARWKKGLHPTDELIKHYIFEGVMYLVVDGIDIIGAMAVTMKQEDDYHAINWSINAEDHDVAVIHILGVKPSIQRSGIAKHMIDEAICLAKKENKQAVRLDALASNIPAHRMYENKGFIYRGKQNLFAENTGLTDYYFYEYLL